jgi:hypothetical protein
MSFETSMGVKLLVRVSKLVNIVTRNIYNEYDRLQFMCKYNQYRKLTPMTLCLHLATMRPCES